MSEESSTGTLVHSIARRPTSFPRADACGALGVSLQTGILNRSSDGQAEIVHRSSGCLSRSHYPANHAGNTTLKRLRFTFVKNAFANVMRGGASAVVAIVLPHFLTRDLSVDRFSAWVLMLQIAAYSNYLDFGIQTAVARYVAQAIERNDDEQRDRVVSTSLLLLTAAGVLAFGVACFVAWQIPTLFHNAPLNIIGELRGGALILSAAAAALLPLSAFTGVLVGLHRNEYPAIAMGGTRLLGAVGVLVLIRHTQSLTWLALCIAGFNLLGGLLQYGVCRHLQPTMRIRLGSLTRKFTRELLNYCAGLTVFSFGMLLVGGLDLVVVGYFAFGTTGYYAIAATLTNFMVGMSGAIFSALLAPLAVLQERKEHLRIRELVIGSSRIGSYASLTLIVLAYLGGKPLLILWVGPIYAAHALPILEILLWAQAVRLSGSAYSVALVATAQQNLAIVCALTEGITNFLASVIGARFFGPIGVAWGTLIGAIFGVLCLILYVMPRVKEVPMGGLTFSSEVFLRPLFCFIPLLLYIALHADLHLSPGYLFAVVPVSSLLLAWVGRIPGCSTASQRSKAFG
jgi:O-antigen/teichoic acid export membrane protein